MKLDTSTDSLALEIRDGDLLLTSFFVLDCNGFELRELGPPKPEAWWQGLEDTEAGIVLLHGYGDRKLGQHKGVTALTTIGHVIWEKPDLAFYGMGAGVLYAHEVARPGEGLQVLQLHTGLESANRVSQEEAAEEVALYGTFRYRECTYPMLYLEGEEYFEEVRQFLEETQQLKAVKAVEYVETDKHIIISYYQESKSGTLDNFLLVFNLNADLCFSECLGSELSGIGSDTFFIFKTNLFFVQRKQCLQIYNLQN